MTTVADPVETLLGPNGAVVVPVAAPTFTRHGDEFLVQGGGADLLLTGLRDGSEGVHGELTVTCTNERGQVEDVHWGRLNLASTAAREALVKKLVAVKPEIPWRSLLETACRRTATEIRQGSPTIMLRPRLATGPRYLVEPLLPLNEPTVLYGDGGSGKGWLAVACALAISQGRPLLTGIASSRRDPVLYLDWESTHDDLEERLYLLGGRGDGVHYKKMARALADEASMLRGDVSRLQVGAVIIDSWGPACGLEPEGADATVRGFNALRSLNTTSLIIAHVNKSQADQKRGASRPFGSVFVANLARCTWELRQSDTGDDEMLVSLFNRKLNRGRKHAPITIRFTFTPEAVTVRKADIGEAPDLLARTSLYHQLCTALAHGPRTVEALAETLDTDEGTIRKILSRYKAKNAFVAVPGTKPQQWALGSLR